MSSAHLRLVQSDGHSEYKSAFSETRRVNMFVCLFATLFLVFLDIEAQVQLPELYMSNCAPDRISRVNMAAQSTSQLHPGPFPTLAIGAGVDGLGAREHAGKGKGKVNIEGALFQHLSTSGRPCGRLDGSGGEGEVG